MKKLAIIGGGISGLICAYVFSNRNMDVALFESRKLGGEFLSGGLKYLHSTPQIKRMLKELEIPYSDFKVKGGLLYKGHVEKYPEIFQNMETKKRKQILIDHYVKTRMIEPGDNFLTSMNNPSRAKSKSAVRCNHEELTKELFKKVVSRKGKMINKAVNFIGQNFIETIDKVKYDYDYLIFTIPLWIMKRIAVIPGLVIPRTYAMNLNLILVTPKRDKYVKYDYVYTPYTPGNAIHRISPESMSYYCEVNGDLDVRMVDVVSDLNFLFDSRWSVVKIVKNLKGHLHPLKYSLDLPSNICAIGRFAKWDSRSTVDVVLDDCLKLSRRWY